MGVSENKIHRNSGIFIGMGIGIILAGILASYSLFLLYDEISYALVMAGINPNEHYLIGQLDLLASIGMGAIVFGVLCLIPGILFETKGFFRGLFESPSRGLLARLWVPETILAGVSAQNLSYYLLLSNPAYYLSVDAQIYLQFFILWVLLLIVLPILGITVARLRRRPKRKS
jgi:hypothetical protein